MALATTTQQHLLQHPTHQHPLELKDLTDQITQLNCRLCKRRISAEAYICREGCENNAYTYHRECAEAPPRLDRHPLHLLHPLTLIHGSPAFECNACVEEFASSGSSFWCCECEFDLDIGCALSSLSDLGIYQGGETPEEIALPLHPHPLTSFSTRHDFIGDSDCFICRRSVQGDGYTCLRRRCGFIIHKRCIPDLYYTDGTKAPRVYHGHQMEILQGSYTCSSCESDESGEFIGCASCQVFYHRNCFQIPEFIGYPSHDPDHALVLFPDIGTPGECQSCSRSLENQIYYRCIDCEFFSVHIGCALEVIDYFEKGMRPEIQVSWHDHTLFLSHRTKSGSECCLRCGDEFPGPAYACKEQGCGFLLHEECTGSELKIHHPYHPDHPLTFRNEVEENFQRCEACHNMIFDNIFSCELCGFYLHGECAARVPTLKHYLHEHKLLRVGEVTYMKCKRCDTRTDSPFFRCVQCDFNLHEKCMELPLVVKHKTHFHPLTLRESYVEDNSGVYYCDLCEEKRDERLCVYVCEECKVTWAFHIECILPELQKVFVRKRQSSIIMRLAEEIATKDDEIRATEEKLEEMKRELSELVKMHEELISREDKNFVDSTENSRP